MPGRPLSIQRVNRRRIKLTGPQGPAGQDGSVVSFGTENPNDADGNNLDVYLKVDHSSIVHTTYQKIDDTWQDIGEIIDPHPWTDYSPDISSTGGSYTTIGQGRYKKVGTIIYLRVGWVQTTDMDDSASGAFTFTLPYESVSHASTMGAQIIGLGSSGIVTSQTLIGSIDVGGSICTVTAVDRSFPADHAVYQFTGFYEVDSDAVPL